MAGCALVLSALADRPRGSNGGPRIIDGVCIYLCFSYVRVHRWAISVSHRDGTTRPYPIIYLDSSFL